MKKTCQSKIKHTCSSINYATCIQYESEVNTDSELFEVECKNLEETTQDVYNQLENLDLSALGELCLEYVTTEDGKNIVKNVLLKFEEEICDLKNRVEELENRQLCDIPIGACLESFDCLVTPCDTTIVTLADWMLAVQTKLCETP